MLISVSLHWLGAFKSEMMKSCDIHRHDEEEIGEFGGSGDYLDQQFGFRLAVCDLREGYSRAEDGGHSDKLQQVFRGKF